MRIPHFVLSVGRAGLALAAVGAGSVLLLSADKQTGFTVHDKAYYADQNLVNFVRPGLSFQIVSAKIAQDGTISVDYKLSDPKGLPLDLSGVTTPGAVSVSFVAAYLPQGQTQFWSYTTRAATNAATKKTEQQAGADSGGTTTKVAEGEYLYTFKTKAVAQAGGAFDPTATHRIAMYGNRNLTEFDLGTSYADTWSDFVPAGGTPSNATDVVRTEACNACHDQLAAHGGSRRSVQVCDVCHTPQTTDPDTGNTVDMKVFIHKIHAGAELPSVQAGRAYQIIGFNNSVNDYSTIVYPAAPNGEGVKRCETCHDPAQKAAQQNAYLTRPNRDACGSCHDNVNFATGQNHVNLPVFTDNQCSQCHIPQGENEIDASIKNAHIIHTEPPQAPGVNVDITKVTNTSAGQKPTVTFTIKDNKGNGITMAQMTGGSNRIGLVMAGPASDYGYTKFGADVSTPGYVSENPVPTAQCSTDGTCTYTFAHAIPANATGTYSIGIEARRAYTILPGTTQEIVTEYGATNKVANFSVDGSKVQAQRTVVTTDQCNQCHFRLSVHGENRNQIEMCVLCHNPSETDSARRPGAVVAADKTAPPQSVNLTLMIHKIHTGEKMVTDFNTSYTVVGFGGSHNDFSDVRYPAMSPNGTTGDTAKCAMCHVNGSELNLPVGLNNVVDPQGLLNPAPATTSACTACHQQKSAVAHAVLSTDARFGESCDVCHGSGAEFDVDKVHAGK